MLEGIESVEWHHLYHAYGEADDVPELLRALLSPDPQERGRAQSALYGNVYHQGTVYSATAAVASILLGFLEDASTPDREWILDYLASVAMSYIESRTADPEVYSWPKSAWIYWMHDAYEAHQAVREGLLLFVRLLDVDADAGVRRGAARVLATLRDDATDAATALNARLPVEQNQWVRAAIQFGLADLTPDLSAQRVLLVAALAAEHGEGARIQLAMRLVDESGNEAPAEALVCVVQAIPEVTRWSIRAASTAATQFEQEPGQESAQAARGHEIWNELSRLERLNTIYPNLESLARALQRIEAQRIQQAFPSLLAACRAVDASPAPVFFELESVIKTMIHIAFADTEQNAESPHTLNTLTPEQRETLVALSESDLLWRHGSGNVRNLLRSLGAPLERDNLRRFVSS